MRRLALNRLDTEDRLHLALEGGLIQVHFQPIVQVGSERVIGAEALARWYDAEIGVVPPAVFVPLAEDTGLIVPLGIKVLATACTAAAGWPSQLSVSVNLSARQMRDPDLADHVEMALKEADLDPSRLVLEITETVLMEDVATNAEVLRKLHTLGVHLAIDDFGTGYSSLAYLKRFPVAHLKIDRSFVDALPEHDEDVAIVTAVINMGHSLGLEVLAEGVETQPQLNTLQALGCDLAQGFLFSHALTGSEFTRWLDEGGLRESLSPACSGGPAPR